MSSTQRFQRAIVPLREAPEAGLRRVGGKALALGKLLQAGLPVPDGFVVTTDAFRAGVVPAALRQHVSPGVAYAVRSSAIAEDLSSASFAGQHDTFLDVRGADAVEDKVRACFASLDSARAVAYRQRAGLADHDLAMAVLVQEMVPARTSGVLFTADPLTGSRQVAMLEAIPGLGEALLSGRALPDQIRYDRRAGSVLSYTPARWPLLSPDQIRAVVELGDAIEDLLGPPQDIEWCLTDERLFVVQARPMTALPPVPSPRPGDDGLHTYLGVGPLKGMSEPMPPLVRDFWSALVQAEMDRLGWRVPGHHWTAEAAGRLYLDVTPVLRRRKLRRRLLRGLSSVHEPASDGLTQLVRARPADFRRGARPPWPPPRVFRWIPGTAGTFFRAFVAPPRDLSQERAWYEDWGRRVAARVRNRSRDPLEHAEAALAVRDQLERLLRIHPRVMTVFAGLAAAGWLERLAPDAPDDVNDAGAGFPEDVITRLAQQLGDVADAARQAPAVRQALLDGRPLVEVLSVEGARPFQEALEALLEAFGHRATGEMDLSQPRWSEDPSTLLRTIRANLTREAPGAHREHLAQLVARGEAAGRRLVACAPWWKRPWVALAVRTLRGCLPVREYPKHGIAYAFEAWREAFVHAGRCLVERGQLDDVDDVWFLHEPELRHALRSGAPIRADLAARKRRHEQDRRTPAPVVLTSEGEDAVALLPPRALPEHALGGTGASGGAVEGVARVVHDPTRSTVEPGEILVAPSCDPGWTPLFLNAAALVTEVGGRVSHGALVAREYGLPAVVSVAGATRLIRTGQRLRVDGTRGIVELLD